MEKIATSETSRQAWWKTGLIAAVIGAVIPLATLVQGSLQKRRELALQQQDQLQELRLAYMKAMVDGGVERVELLADFIADTEPEASIREWAERQREKSRATVAQLEKRIAEEQARAAAADAQRRTAEHRLKEAEERARRIAQADTAGREQAERATAAAREQAAKAETDAKLRQAEVLREREKLHGTVLMRSSALSQAQQTTLQAAN